MRTALALLIAAVSAVGLAAGQPGGRCGDFGDDAQTSVDAYCSDPRDPTGRTQCDLWLEAAPYVDPCIDVDVGY